MDSDKGKIEEIVSSAENLAVGDQIVAAVAVQDVKDKPVEPKAECDGGAKIAEVNQVEDADGGKQMDEKAQVKHLRILLDRAVRDALYKSQELRSDVAKMRVVPQELRDKFQQARLAYNELANFSPLDLSRKKELMDLIDTIPTNDYANLPEEERLEKINRRAQADIKDKLEKLRMNLSKRQQLKADWEILERKRLEVGRVSALQRSFMKIPLSGPQIVYHKDHLLQLISEVPTDEAIEALDEE